MSAVASSEVPNILGQAQKVATANLEKLEAAHEESKNELNTDFERLEVPVSIDKQFKITCKLVLNGDITILEPEETILTIKILEAAIKSKLAGSSVNRIDIDDLESSTEGVNMLFHCLLRIDIDSDNFNFLYIDSYSTLDIESY